MIEEADEVLVRACRQGDPGAWEQLTRLYRDLVGRVVRRVALRQGFRMGEVDLEDIASEVFASLLEDDYRRLKRYDSRYPLAAYLRLIARSHALDALRARRRRKRIESAGRPPATPADPTSESDAADLRKRLETLLAGLEERERAVIRLYFLADRT